MLDCTDRHARHLMRLISRHAWLYTEMVTTGALLRGQPERWLNYSTIQHPLALQLGGSDPVALAHCAILAQEWGYDEVNLNVGCPSDRVQGGRFGACLMAEPARVADCVAAMAAVVRIPITVKTRLGIDDLDNDVHLHHFVATVAAAGCRTFIVHARKAWLQGLSPHENRTVPPLQYERVHHLKAAMPELEFILNGGLTDLNMALAAGEGLDGVMLGRAIYDSPYRLAGVDASFYGDAHSIPDRIDVVRAYGVHAQKELTSSTPLNALTRPLLGMFNGLPGARAFRRHLSKQVCHPGADWSVVEQALESWHRAALPVQQPVERLVCWEGGQW
jgi:tRNA-dihydrouridine synthase A